MSAPLAAVRRVAVVLAATCVVVALAMPAHAAPPPILGAGSTWSEIAITQWRYDVVSQGLTVNYQGVGSSQGRQFFANGTVDFGVSEIPYQPEEPKPNFPFRYLPIVAGGTSMMYDVPSPSGDLIRDLRLSSATIAGIFTGQITKWNDKRIAADYGKPLPDLPIKVVVRSDGSGTSAQFSKYLDSVQASTWDAFMKKCKQAPTFTSFYPYGPGCLDNGVGQRGSDGVANYIANPGLGVGAIGYVETGYAVDRQFPVVAVKNASGAFVYATAHNVSTALQHAKINDDSTQNLADVYTAPEKDAYPISSYSYMLVPTSTAGISPDKGNTLGQFIIYFACKGQQQAEPLGYSPLPKALIEFTFAAEKQIPGAPDPPAITGTACPNPTLTGSFYQSKDTAPPSGSVWWSQSTGDNGTGGGTSGGGDGGTGGGTSGGTGDGTSGGSDGGPGASGTPGTDGTITITASPTVLDDAELAAMKKLADQRILGLTPPPAFPLIVIAVAVLVLVFGPLFLRLRRREG